MAISAVPQNSPSQGDRKPYRQSANSPTVPRYPWSAEASNPETMAGMTSVRCDVVRWVNNEPKPGLVEASLVDVHDKTWLFVDKAPIFAASSISPTSTFPFEAAIRCRIVEVSHLTGRDVVLIDTATPDGLVSIDGENHFFVHGSQIV